MNISYEMKIYNLTVLTSFDGLTNVVKTVHWKYVGVDEESQVAQYIMGKTDVPDPDSGNFVDYDLLTKETVEGWLINQIGASTILDYQNAIYKMIENILYPKTLFLSPPWDKLVESDNNDGSEVVEE